MKKFPSIAALAAELRDRNSNVEGECEVTVNIKEREETDEDRMGAMRLERAIRDAGRHMRTDEDWRRLAVLAADQGDASVTVQHKIADLLGDRDEDSP